MSMSLDGCIAGPNDGPDNPGGDDFMRLHDWFVTPDGEFIRPSGPAGASAMEQAKAAAGDRDVMVHGAYTAQRALEAGVLDELQIHQVPVLFGGGRPLFELLPSRLELEIVRVIDTPEATHIRYRVRR
jgi:riboflavin biosynthesis pyrimidine reductase